MFFLCLLAFLAAFITRKIMKDDLPDATSKILLIVEVIALVLIFIYIIVTIVGMVAVGAANSGSINTIESFTN